MILGSANKFIARSCVGIVDQLPRNLPLDSIGRSELRVFSDDWLNLVSSRTPCGGEFSRAVDFMGSALKRKRQRARLFQIWIRHLD